MPTPLPAAHSRLVGLLFIVSGVLLALGLLVRLVLMAYLWEQTQADTAALPLGLVLFNLLGLVAAGLLVRYGRRLRQGGSMGTGPVGEILL